MVVEEEEEEEEEEIPVWNLRNTRNRAVKARGPTCTHGYFVRYVDSEVSCGEEGSNALVKSSSSVASPIMILASRRK